MTYKELCGYINRGIDEFMPYSGYSVTTTKPDADVDSQFYFSVDTVLNSLVGTLEVGIKLICTLPVDSEGTLLDALDAVISAVSVFYKPTAEGYIVGDYQNRGYSYIEIPTLVYTNGSQEEKTIDLPVVAREYHRVEIPVGFYFSLEYEVTEEPSEDAGGETI